MRTCKASCAPHLGQDVGECNTGQATHSPASGEAVPAAIHSQQPSSLKAPPDNPQLRCALCFLNQSAPGRRAENPACIIFV